MSQPASQNLTAQVLDDDRHLVHLFSELASLRAEGARTVIAEASGAYVYDADGNRYLDGIGGLWCVNVGHGRREIVDAVAEQLRKLDYYSTFYNLTHPTAARLAARLAALAPGDLDHVVFGNSGSVANDAAVRIVQNYWHRRGRPNKTKVLSRIGAYHGSTYLAIGMTTPAYREHWQSAADLVHFLSSPGTYRRPDGMSEAEFLDFLMEEMETAIVRLGPEHIACFIAEPIMGAGGVIVAPAGYHRRALELCHRYEIKYVSDEVVTAFGRLGHMFASREVFDVQPDVITCAKGLTSGYQPLSATLLSSEIHDVIAGEGAMFMHGMTYAGHPACCAAALANIDIIENEDLCGHVQRRGPEFERTLRALETHEIVGEVRGSHFMMGIEFVRDKDSREAFEAEARVGWRVAQEAQKRGVIVRPLGSMIVMSPPLILDEAQIATLGEVLHQSIAAAVEGLHRDGLL